MPDQDPTLGEIYRMCQATNAQLVDLTKEVRDRHHLLAGEVNAAIGPISTLRVQMSSAERQLERLDEDVRTVTNKAAYVSGVGAVLAFIAAMIPWPWRNQ